MNKVTNTAAQRGSIIPGVANHRQLVKFQVKVKLTPACPEIGNVRTPVPWAYVTPLVETAAL
jgi:hypothetical protein